MNAWGTALLFALGLGAGGCDQFARIGVVAGEAPGGTGASAAPATGGDTIGGGGSEPDPDAPLAGGADGGTRTGCEHPTVAVCNPVTNRGCPAELMMQCAIDLAAPRLAGYCTFYAPMTSGGCLNTGVTESCPPTSTCVAGTCRRICLCDLDCGPGFCCQQAIGNYGFGVCSEC